MVRGLLRTMAAAGPKGVKDGFTLIEVLMSMVITMTALLAILAMVNTSFRSYSRGKRLTEATNLAYQKLQDFKTVEVAAIADGTDVVTPANTQYTRTWTVSDVNLDADSDGVPDLQGDIVKVDLEVTWTHGGRDYRVSMATMTTGKPQ